jgi:hypothetical protein
MERFLNNSNVSSTPSSSDKHLNQNFKFCEFENLDKLQEIKIGKEIMKKEI